MVSPHIRLGQKMKTWFTKIILKDFGDISYAKGLFNVLTLYNQYVPQKAKKKLNGGKRLTKRKWI